MWTFFSRVFILSALQTFTIHFFFYIFTWRTEHTANKRKKKYIWISLRRNPIQTKTVNPKCPWCMKRVKLLPFIFEFTWLQKKFTIEWLNKQTWKYEIFSLYFITFSYLIIHIYAHAHLHSYIFSIVANRKIKHSNILNWIEWEPYVVGVRISRAIKI